MPLIHRRVLRLATTRPRSCFTVSFHNFIRAVVTERNVRVHLDSPNVVGVASSRGTRRYQQDQHQICAIDVDPLELQATIKRTAGVDWNISKLPSELASQVLFCGLYDGHGGSQVSDFLQQEMHRLFENARREAIPETYKWVKSLGGYFKRFRGGALTEWVENPDSSTHFDLDARSTLAFLQADKAIAEQIPQSSKIGSTASVVMLHSLDIPTTPFYVSRRVALTVAHCGDTRVLLCATKGGEVYPMTEKHHADARGEASRLRRMGTGLITDSFGEARWMGAVENTRGLGDGMFKRFGVTPEPEISGRVLIAPEWAYIIMVSDGVSSILSDQEIVDIARHAARPSTAASEIIAFAEELGTEDNASAIVIPLAGWGNVDGPDKTKDLRVYRQNQAVGSERQRRM